jgi:hypothetical protein
MNCLFSAFLNFYIILILFRQPLHLLLLLVPGSAEVVSAASSGESSPAFPGLESGLVFWPLMKRLDESGLEFGLTSPKFDGKKTRLQLGKDS